MPNSEGLVGPQATYCKGPQCEGGHSHRCHHVQCRGVGTVQVLPGGRVGSGGFSPVSYTHLTLPTICSV
eukprot:9967797-Alexandrium_andersonii.AAC.1